MLGTRRSTPWIANETPYGHACFRHGGAAHAGDSPDGVRSGGRPREIKLAASYFLVTPLLVPAGRPSAWLCRANAHRCLNTGLHGSEVLYAFTSAANNEGSAFAGLSANTVLVNAASSCTATQVTPRTAARDEVGVGPIAAVDGLSVRSGL
jgi:hypothetical protein